MKFRCLLVVLLALGNHLFAKETRPNIVIFITDDQSQLDCSAYGSKEFRTPNMQRLANAGLTFDRAFVASPSCAPSRAALLTGLMPARNGAEPNHSKPHADVKKWPAYFQELGYEVVAFGKVAHYNHGAEYGFDHFANDGSREKGGLQGVSEASKFLNKRASTKPLCLFVGTHWPHVPWPEQMNGFEPAKLSLPAGSVDTSLSHEWRARYAAAVTKADDDLGTICGAARATLGTNTIFLFTSDHGAQWPFGKWNLYDAGTRVPLVVVWPGITKPGSRTEAMVSWIDLLPTLLDAAGGKAPMKIDGKSFIRVLRGKTKGHRDQIFSTHSGDGRWNIYPSRSLRTEDWKYIRNPHPEFAFTTHIDLGGSREKAAYFPTWHAAAMTNAEAATILNRYYQRPAEELYDLKADPNEQNNLARDSRHASRLKKLRTELDSWMRKQGDKQTVFETPRLLSDSSSYGSNALPGDAPRKPSKQ